MQVQDTYLAGVHDRPDGRYAGAVVGFLVLPVLHKLARQNVRLKLRPGDEVVVLPVTLCLSPSSGCVCGGSEDVVGGEGGKEGRMYVGVYGEGGKE